MRRFDCGKTFVRLVMMLNWRPGKKGIFSGSRTCPSSITSPVRISFDALSTCSGFMRFPEPRSSPAPHFEGQRWFSAGGFQDCAVATRATSRRGTTVVIRDRIIVAPLEVVPALLAFVFALQRRDKALFLQLFDDSDINVILYSRTASRRKIRDDIFRGLACW